MIFFPASVLAPPWTSFFCRTGLLFLGRGLALNTAGFSIFCSTSRELIFLPGPALSLLWMFNFPASFRPLCWSLALSSSNLPSFCLVLPPPSPPLGGRGAARRATSLSVSLSRRSCWLGSPGRPVGDWRCSTGGGGGGGSWSDLRLTSGKWENCWQRLLAVSPASNNRVSIVL